MLQIIFSYHRGVGIGTVPDVEPVDIHHRHQVHVGESVRHCRFEMPGIHLGLTGRRQSSHRGSEDVGVGNRCRIPPAAVGITGIHIVVEAEIIHCPVSEKVTACILLQNCMLCLLQQLNVKLFIFHQP